MIIDCDTCVMRDIACGECVIGVLHREAPATEPVELPEVERAAIEALAVHGLVRPLRLRPAR